MSDDTIPVTAGGAMRSYREPDADDTACHCGRQLAEAPIPFSWPDHGFCHRGCALGCAAPFRLRGTAICLDVVRTGAGIGPGFEESILRPALKALEGVPGGMLALEKLRSEDIGLAPGSWAWRLQRTDQAGTFCESVAFRLTRRGDAA